MYLLPIPSPKPNYLSGSSTTFPPRKPSWPPLWTLFSNYCELLLTTLLRYPSGLLLFFKGKEDPPLTLFFPRTQRGEQRISAGRWEARLMRNSSATPSTGILTLQDPQTKFNSGQLSWRLLLFSRPVVTNLLDLTDHQWPAVGNYCSRLNNLHSFDSLIFTELKASYTYQTFTNSVQESIRLANTHCLPVSYQESC